MDGDCRWDGRPAYGLAGFVDAREDFSKTKLGTLLHLCFLVHGDQECLSGFTTCIRGVLDLVGHEIVWADPAEPEDEPQKPTQVVVN